MKSAFDQASNRSEERRQEIGRLGDFCLASARESVRRELEKLSDSIEPPQKRSGEAEGINGQRSQLQSGIKREAERTEALSEMKAELAAATRRETERKRQLDSLSDQLASNAEKSRLRDAELAALRSELAQKETDDNRRNQLETLQKELLAAHRTTTKMSN